MSKSYWAQVNVRITTRDDLLTYYSNSAKSPEAALKDATKAARSEHPRGQVVGHRVWSD